VFVAGDHAYKQSEGLSAQEQMITALPDVRTLMIDPTEDEFMVLACDGIWNFMSSQEVVDFVRPRIQDGQTKLSQICEEVRGSGEGKKLHGLSPRANYTDRATATCRRSNCQLFADRGCHVVSVTDPCGLILGFLDRSRYFSIK
jgi:hypothetical protein